MPDCEESYMYIISAQVLEVSADQLSALASGPYARAIAEAELHGLYRDVQPLNGRLLYHRIPIVESESFLF